MTVSPVSRTAGRASRPRLTAMTSSRAASQASTFRPTTGPRREEITAIRAPSDSIAAASTAPSVRIGCPDISAGTSTPK